MLGFVGSIKVNESPIWDYASVVIYEENGCCIRLHRGKIFNSELLKIISTMSAGDQIKFEEVTTQRGSRRYTELTSIEPTSFESCAECGLPSHVNECKIIPSERLKGEFKVIDLTEIEFGTKIVFRQKDQQFTFIQWVNGQFKDTFEVGDTAYLIGWRDNNRVTQLRTLYKVETLA